MEVMKISDKNFFTYTLSDFTRNIAIAMSLEKLCERSELVNISQLFLSFSQSRLRVVELS